MLNIALIAILVALAYFFWIRPILKTQPSLQEFYEAEGNFFSALNLKLAGIRQKLLGAVSVIAIVVVQIYDNVLPMITGVDTTKLTEALHIPDWAWPILTIAGILLMNRLRQLADQRHLAVVEKIADDSATTMKAASIVVQQTTGTNLNEAMETIVDVKKEIIAADVTQTQPM